MIIDAILDRKDGRPYDENDMRHMYDMATHFEFNKLAQALDCGEDADIRRELCAYIDSEGYNSEIKDYIDSVNWTRFDR